MDGILKTCWLNRKEIIVSKGYFNNGKEPIIWHYYTPNGKLINSYLTNLYQIISYLITMEVDVIRLLLIKNLL